MWLVFYPEGCWACWAHMWPFSLHVCFGWECLDTPLKTNIAPEKWWLEDKFPFEMIPFYGTFVNFQGKYPQIVIWQDDRILNSMKLNFFRKDKWLLAVCCGWSSHLWSRAVSTHLSCVMRIVPPNLPNQSKKTGRFIRPVGRSWEDLPGLPGVSW